MTAPAQPGLLDNEPALVIGLIQAFGQALLTALTAFGLDLDTEQTAALHGLAGAALAITGAILTRRRSYAKKPLDNVVAAAEAAAATQDTPPVKSPRPHKVAAKARKKS